MACCPNRCCMRDAHCASASGQPNPDESLVDVIERAFRAAGFEISPKDRLTLIGIRNHELAERHARDQRRQCELVPHRSPKPR
jgi:hypothetical protein